MPHSTTPAWPPLPLEPWQATYHTLHLWSQIVGKIKLAHAPWVNHAWHVPLTVTAVGLGTDLIPAVPRSFEIEFDLSVHQLVVRAAGGPQAAFPLEPMTVAAFYGKVMETLDGLGLDAQIWPRPVEMADPITAFPSDERHAAYDVEAVERFRQVLVDVHRVLSVFRARFIGKASPIQFFWGGFDLALSRFSGRPAPKHPGGVPNCADWVMEEAYSHEQYSAGFWPGAGLGEPAFYAFIYPEPDGLKRIPVKPDAAYYHADLREFILPYEAVRSSADPDGALLDFLETTYAAAADQAAWDRAALEQREHPGIRKG